MNGIIGILISLNQEIRIMIIVDKLYSLFSCLVREDGNGDQHKRVVLLIDMTTTFVLSFIMMVLLGLFNIRLTAFFLWIIAISFLGLISYRFYYNYFIKSNRYVNIEEINSRIPKKRKTVYAIIAALIYILSLLLLLGGGILMSYLLSLH